MQCMEKCISFSPPWRNKSGVSGPPHYRGITITLRHTTLGWTLLDEWWAPARSRDPYLTTHNAHKRQTSLQPAGFKPTVPASEGLNTDALYRAGTGIGSAVHNANNQFYSSTRLVNNEIPFRYVVHRLVPGVGLRPLPCWDCGFAPRNGHTCSYVVSVVACQLEFSATSWSLVQRSPIECGAS